MDREHVRQLVWESLLNADLRSRYFGHLAGSLQTRERVLTIIVGVLSSGAFLALIIKTEVAYLPHTFSALAALGSILLANLKLGKSAALSASIYSKWLTIQREYELLWAQLDSLSSEQAAKRWRDIESQHAKEDETAVQEFRLNKRLADECQRDVLRVRRLAEVA